MTEAMIRKLLTQVDNALSQAQKYLGQIPDEVQEDDDDYDDLNSSISTARYKIEALQS